MIVVVRQLQNSSEDDMEKYEKWRVKDPLGIAGFSKRLEQPDDPKVEKLPSAYKGSIENDPLWEKGVIHMY